MKQMKVYIEIDTENEAFGPDEYSAANETVNVLMEICESIENASLLEDMKIQDTNGNTCGKMTVTH